jgi:ribose transport system ATP-binding protein
MDLDRAHPAQPSEVPLHLQGVVKSFGGITVLDLAELTVRAGEIHALIGQNGSGKSTVIKILAGYHQPDSVLHASSCGEELQIGSAVTAHKAGFRFVHQDLGLVGALDTVDNFALGVGYDTQFGGRISWRKAIAEANDAIHRLGYDFDVRKPVVKLTPVQRTVVAVARALRQQGPDTTMLVLDEPTATMPGPEVDRLLNVARTVAASGTAVLFVSHHLDEVMSAADTVTVLRDGKVVESTRVSSVDKNHLIQQVTGGFIHDVRTEPTAEKVREHERPVLSLTGVSGKYLKPIDLDVWPGEIVGISGITGSGRDEVGPLVFGAQPRVGTVEIAGEKLTPHSPYHSVRSGLGYLPANRLTEGIFATLSIRENVTLPLLNPHWKGLRLRTKAERQEIAGLRTEYGIRGATDESAIATLSGGNQQKACIAKWMRTNPSVLILDEPTQGIDVGAQADVHRLVAEAAESGLAVVICSSDEVELAALCSRVLVLQAGQVVRELIGEDVTVPSIVDASLSATHAPEVAVS